MNEFNSLLKKSDLKDFSNLFEESKMATLKQSSSLLTERKSLFNIKQVGSDLLISVGETVVIGEEKNMSMSLEPQIISTKSVDKFKQWIGRSNKYADNYPWKMPSKAWSTKKFIASSELSATEVSDIEKAGWIYLFNDANKVADYKNAIEQFRGTFEASLYNFRRIIIQPGGKLILKGNPAVLLIEEMKILGNGQFETRAICHASIGSLTKTEQAIFINN
ncbi:hypothetical protein [Lacinutrix sp. Bg11-31]|uniref:hypothetical protein n=1 Tax=Lacinutrix sp. Bg11-31 TaxID=2057808 RepID=UPI000C31B43D|nr:hypothetical protein [Lacinutrix sp. Bg11-31]AUC81455.1 hypothetical protein CW733_04655 [Lacinutrix sp. Bg11-31]